MYAYIYTVELKFGPPKIWKLLKFRFFGPKILYLKMLQNATNQRSLAFLDQKIAIMYKFKTLLIKYTFNKKKTIEQIKNKTNML